VSDNPENRGGLTADETSRLRTEVALLILAKHRAEKQLLEAFLIIGPLADLADAFTGNARDAVIQESIPVADGEPPRFVRIDIGHLRWAQRWREALYEFDPATGVAPENPPEEPASS
jgi:hypothetical protein